ncbi:hypothetical protein RP726_05390 [Candidatus Methylospira mobilis]|uniref:hypothetical protein n=1 Tax=Candidatus Methylospira mobilis TaxID=1808979 RepID=UPI0028E8C63A|nr:hypothetical protein [Candidatus Methylospira mobilis]WNV05846.1 hypothetical protein RP726_05390 [Candidatus Methylospira mobilis]
MTERVTKFESAMQDLKIQLDKALAKAQKNQEDAAAYRSLQRLMDKALAKAQKNQEDAAAYRSLRDREQCEASGSSSPRKL